LKVFLRGPTSLLKEVFIFLFLAEFPLERTAEGREADEAEDMPGVEVELVEILWGGKEAAAAVNASGVLLNGLTAATSVEFNKLDSELKGEVVSISASMVDPAVVARGVGPILGFLACRRCLASASRFSS